MAPSGQRDGSEATSSWSECRSRSLLVEIRLSASQATKPDQAYSTRVSARGPRKSQKSSDEDEKCGIRKHKLTDQSRPAFGPQVSA